MRARVIAGLWVFVGLVIWNAFFDLYVSRGAREYLQTRLEFELGRRSEPSMDEVMGRAKRDGLLMSSVWTALVVGSGLTTLRIAGRGRGARDATGADHPHRARST